MRKAFLKLALGCEVTWTVDDNTGELCAETDARPVTGKQIASTTITKATHPRLIAKVLEVQPQFPRAVLQAALYTLGGLRARMLRLLTFYDEAPTLSAAPAVVYTACLTAVVTVASAEAMLKLNSDFQKWLKEQTK